jgi:hypothetical protein
MTIEIKAVNICRIGALGIYIINVNAYKKKYTRI